MLYGYLMGESGEPGRLFVGYLVGAGFMAMGGIAELWLGVRAE
ncbi:hypothetical protein [Methylomagnum sp.]